MSRDLALRTPRPDPAPDLLRSAPTLAEVIAAVEAAALPPARAKRIAGDIRIVAGWFDRAPDRIAAHPAALRRKLSALHHAHLGISAKRRANILSNLRRGLELAGTLDTRPSGKPMDALTGPWRDLWERIAGTWPAGMLSQFMRYCAAHGVAPEAVSDAAFEAWGAWRAAGTGSIARDPLTAVDKARRAWNACAARVPGWPPHRVTVARRRVRVTLDLDAFPRGFREDLARFCRQRGLKAAGPRRRFRNAAGTAERKALAPSKVERCVQALRLAATTAVEEGTLAPEAITEIGAVLTVDVAEATLERIAERAGLSEYVLTVAKNLKCVATRWLTLSPDEKDAWADLVASTRATLRAEIGFDPDRMTARNRERLGQFTDPLAVSRLFSYPWAVFDALEPERKRRKAPTREMALKAMSAIAVALLTLLPLRRGSLRLVEWDDHVALPPRDGHGRLSLPGHLVKNDRDLAAPLPAELVRILKLYRRHYWPLLGGSDANPYVFPAAGGDGPRDGGGLAKNVLTRLAAATGLTMNLHLFRHLMATLALAKAAESTDMAKAAALVEGLLGATPGSRVTRRYAELSSWMAARWLDHAVGRAHRPRRPPRPRRAWRR